MITFRVAQSDEGQASNVWVAGSKHEPVPIFISFVRFYKCIFGVNVIDFEIFETVVVIKFKNLVVLFDPTNVFYFYQTSDLVRL